MPANGDGILRAAADVGADLIVMGSHRKQLLLDIFVGTTIERVIRKGPFPVLMVNNEAQRRYENVLAPVDLSDASVNALQVALSTGLIDPNRVTILHAFFPVAKGKMFTYGFHKANIDRRSGHAAVAPPSSVMNSRGLMGPASMRGLHATRANGVVQHTKIWCQ